MPKLPDPPRDASRIPVEGFVRKIVWGVLFLGGSIALVAAALNDHGRGDWFLMSAAPLALAFLNFYLAKRRRRIAKSLYAQGREVGHEITQITTVLRNGMLSGWVATFRLQDPAGIEPRIWVSLNPQLVPFNVIVHEGRMGVCGQVENTTMFHWQKLPAAPIDSWASSKD
jgi:hypothetical protein